MWVVKECHECQKKKIMWKENLTINRSITLCESLSNFFFSIFSMLTFLFFHQFGGSWWNKKLNAKRIQEYAKKNCISVLFDFVYSKLLEWILTDQQKRGELNEHDGKNQKERKIKRLCLCFRYCSVTLYILTNKAWSF